MFDVTKFKNNVRMEVNTIPLANENESQEAIRTCAVK